MSVKCPHCGKQRAGFIAARRCYFDHVRALPSDLELEVHQGRLSLAEAEERSAHDPMRQLVL